MSSSTDLPDLIPLPDLQATQEMGARLAQSCAGGEIFALCGDLGAGKTELTRSIVRGLGYDGDVTSPTFTLIHEYIGGRLSVCHVDLYRLATASDARKIGLEDYLPFEGITLVEWPERALELFPDSTQWWHLSAQPDGSRILKRQRKS